MPIIVHPLHEQSPWKKARRINGTRKKKRQAHRVSDVNTDVHHRITLTREAARSRAAAAATCRGSAGWRRRRGRPVVAQRPRAGVGVRGSRALMRATVRVPVRERERARGVAGGSDACLYLCVRACVCVCIWVCVMFLCMHLSVCVSCSSFCMCVGTLSAARL